MTMNKSHDISKPQFLNLQYGDLIWQTYCETMILALKILTISPKTISNSV